MAGPLWLARRSEEGGRGPAIGALVVVLLLPALATFLYGRWSNWSWLALRLAASPGLGVRFGK